MTVSMLLAMAWAQPRVAIVVVDQEARDSGFVIEVDGWLVDDALPVDVEPGEVVALHEPDGRVEPLDVAPGEAWEVVGPEGEAWMSRLGEDVRTDRIVVRGSDAAVAALARSLDAEIRVEGEHTWLIGERILFEAPFVDDPKALAVEEVGLVRTDEDEARDAVRPEPSTWTPSPTVGRVERTSRTRFGPVADAPAPFAPAPAPSAPEAPAVLVDAVEKGEPIAVGNVVGRVGDAVVEAYAGLFLCKDDMLWLHPSGVYSLRGVTGTWTVGSPGVVRMTTDSGEVLFRAAIDPDRGFCRDVWTPEETGDPMPQGYGRLSGG